MDGGQGSCRKLESEAVSEMEGQTQTERERDERRQERLMAVCDADKKCFLIIKRPDEGD